MHLQESASNHFKEAGTVEFNLGNFQKSVELYTSAIEEDKENYMNYYNRSLAYFSADEYPASLKDILQCKILKPECIEVYIREALALIEMDQLGEAKSALEQGRKIAQDIFEGANKKMLEISHRIDQEITDRANELKNATTEELQKTGELIKWLQEEHAKISKIRIKHEVNSERSLVAQSTITDGETFLTIPLSVLITFDDLKNNKTIQAAEELTQKLARINSNSSISSRNERLLAEEINKISQQQNVLEAARSQQNLANPQSSTSEIPGFTALSETSKNEQLNQIQNSRIKQNTLTQPPSEQLINHQGQQQSDAQEAIRLEQKAADEKKTNDFEDNADFVGPQGVECQGRQIIELHYLDHSGLAAVLCKEKLLGNESKMFNFIESLPTDFTSFPAEYKQSEMDILEGTTFKCIVKEQQSDIQDDYAFLSAADPAFRKSTSFELFEWAFLCGRSRLFDITIHNKKTNTLVPLADMINHRAKGTQNAEWIFDESSLSLKVKALKKIQRNTEITFTYGAKCNELLLLNYGFIEDSRDNYMGRQENAKKEDKSSSEINIFNEVPIVFNFEDASSDPTLPLKEILLCGKANIEKACLVRITSDFESVNSAGFLGSLRFITLRDSEILKKLSVSHNNFQRATNQLNLPFITQKTPSLSVQNEMDMWSKVQEILIPYLMRYKSSSLKDEALLQEDEKLHKLSRNEKACLMVRLGEKKILEFYIDMACQMSDILKTVQIIKKSTQPQQKQQLQAQLNSKIVGQQCQPFSRYINQVILKRLFHQ